MQNKDLIVYIKSSMDALFHQMIFVSTRMNGFSLQVLDTVEKDKIGLAVALIVIFVQIYYI